MYLAKTPSPLGPITVGVLGDHIVFIDFENPKRLDQMMKAITKHVPGLEVQHATQDLHNEAFQQLRRYFLGQLTAFDLPLYPYGSPFQKEVWTSLQSIPFGETCSYSQQAKDLGKPQSVRAVSTANSRNPISIVIPCHRVIGKSGKLTGYAGGIERKQFLLDLEGAMAVS